MQPNNNLKNGSVLLIVGIAVTLLTKIYFMIRSFEYYGFVENIILFIFGNFFREIYFIILYTDFHIPNFVSLLWLPFSAAGLVILLILGANSLKGKYSEITKTIFLIYGIWMFIGIIVDFIFYDGYRMFSYGIEYMIPVVIKLLSEIIILVAIGIIVFSVKEFQVSSYPSAPVMPGVAPAQDPSRIAASQSNYDPNRPITELYEPSESQSHSGPPPKTYPIPNTHQRQNKASMGEILFSPNGRINRAKYILLMFLVNIFIWIGFGLSLATEFEDGGAIAILFFLITLWTSLCNNIKRCHDRDRSGWFMLIALVPLLGIWYTVETIFLKGTNGDNRFGPDPLL